VRTADIRTGAFQIRSRSKTSGLPVQSWIWISKTDLHS